MKTNLLPLCFASMLLAAAHADPAMNRQTTSQQPNQPVSEVVNVDVSKDLGGRECTVICPLPSLVTADSD